MWQGAYDEPINLGFHLKEREICKICKKKGREGGKKRKQTAVASAVSVSSSAPWRREQAERVVL